MTFKLMLRNFVGGPLTEATPAPDDAAVGELAARVNQAARARLGRTLSIREVDAGSCCAACCSGPRPSQHPERRRSCCAGWPSGSIGPRAAGSAAP